MSLEFDTEKNHPLSSGDVSVGTDKKLWWICSSSGHSYNSKCSNRLKGSGCPYCVGKKVLVGYNDLGTTHPSLALEFDPVRNSPTTPSDVTAGTSKKLWWVCNSHNHSYLSAGRTRVSGRGCGVCVGKDIVVGYNDLGTTHPSMAEEFDAGKNYPLTPSAVVAGTNQKLWWVCPTHNQSYLAKGHSRVRGSACPSCRRESIPEILLRQALGGTKARVDVRGNYHKTKEVDVWLPIMGAVVEYDGWYWHRNSALSDLRQTKALTDAGHKVIRVREQAHRKSHCLKYLTPLDSMKQIQFDPKVGNYQTLASDIVKLIEEMETPHAD